MNNKKKMNWVEKEKKGEDEKWRPLLKNICEEIENLEEKKEKFMTEKSIIEKKLQGVEIRILDLLKKVCERIL